MANERIVESVVRKRLEALGYTNIDSQQSNGNDIIKQALSTASKSGTGNNGYPEFIVHFDNARDMVILVECKAKRSDHERKESDNTPNPKKYAVDGVLHYAEFVCGVGYTVIAIAVSGETNTILSQFICKITDGVYTTRELDSKDLQPADFYIKATSRNPEQEKINKVELVKFARKIHNYLRDYAKLSETEKPLIVGGSLIALYDPEFKNIFRKIPTDKKLAERTVETIERVLNDANLDHDKIRSIIQPYSFIAIHPELTKGSTLKNILIEFDNKFHDIIHDSIDLVGEFYKEFLSYTGGDKKGLGIVLTPQHITELFCDLANLTTDSIVLDPCCGTGGFLISAMADMINKSNGDESTIESIKKTQLIGIEQSPNMFALAASNMILRGDGKTNLKIGSCFGFRDDIKRHKPTVGMINPPYSQKGDGLSELDFIKFMLDCLQPNGIGIAIVPMSCALQTSAVKEDILKEHTLLAAMSMPTELFYPVGTVTSILVFKSHVPHNSEIKTWFGYWKDDGFEKTKTDGRVDLREKYSDIKTEWLDAYRNHKELPGKSVMAHVNSEDEWCAEAYLETDYSLLTSGVFAQAIKTFALYKASIEVI